MQITKGVDKKVLRKFETEARSQGLTIDEALTEAMILWVLKEKK